MKVSGSIDTSDVLAGLDVLAGPLRESLLRSGLVAAGTVIRDEAEVRVPVETGRLKSALYLAYSPERSINGQQVYGVSWRKDFFGGARHGHFIEFGHWRYNKIINGHPQKSLKPGLSRGNGPQDHVPPGALAEPKWVPAKPFLRPAMDAAGARAVDAAAARMRVRLPELLAEWGNGP